MFSKHLHILQKGLCLTSIVYRDSQQKLMASSLRPRASTGLSVTNIHLKTNWVEWLTDTSIASSPLDMPASSSFNIPYHSESSPLSSLEDEDQNNVPFLELEVPELDLELIPLDFQLLPHYTKESCSNQLLQHRTMM